MFKIYPPVQTEANIGSTHSSCKMLPKSLLRHLAKLLQILTNVPIKYFNCLPKMQLPLLQLFQLSDDVGFTVFSAQLLNQL